MPTKVLSIALMLLFIAPTVADGKRKRRRKKRVKADTACGLTFLPLKADSKWTFQNVPPDSPEAARGVQAELPEQINIKVVSIEGNKITLEESYRKVVRQTELSCTGKSLIVDPVSFFWAGEPGGGLQMSLVNLKRSGHSYPGGKEFKRGASLREEFKADVDRKAAEGAPAEIKSGKVEIERDVTIGSSEELTTPFGVFEAVRVEVALSGRGHLEGEKKAEREMAAGANAVLYFAPGTGLIKVINRFNQAWVLKPAADAPPM